MFNRVSALTLSLLFFIILWGSRVQLYVLAIALGLFIVASLVINIRNLGVNWAHLALPCFYILGSGSIFALITNHRLQLLFLILATIVFYFVEIRLGRESHFLQNVYLYAVFAILVGIYGLQFYFHLGFIWTSLLVFIFSYLLIRQGFAGFSLPVKRYFSLLIALVAAQIAWGLSLWPTYYVVNAVITFSVFYLLWFFSFSAFFGKLTRNKIYWQLSLVIIILAITLASASFKPITR